MSVKSSFKCIYCRNSRNNLGVFCHACCTSPPASHPDGERERQRQREDEAGLWCQTVYMWIQLVMRRQIAALKPDEREKRDPTENFSQSIKERRSPWGPDLGRFPICLLLSRMGNTAEHFYWSPWKTFHWLVISLQHLKNCPLFMGQMCGQHCQIYSVSTKFLTLSLQRGFEVIKSFTPY